MKYAYSNLRFQRHNIKNLRVSTDDCFHYYDDVEVLSLIDGDIWLIEFRDKYKATVIHNAKYVKTIEFTLEY